MIKGVMILMAIMAIGVSDAEARHHHRHHHHRHHHHRYHSEGGAVIGGRPSGCPHAYCGCGASLHLFGKIIPSLNLSSNWLKFPRTSPRPRAVAVRRGHVFVLERHISGQTWLVHDSNSGGHKTRLHPRSIAGYVIVDPSRG